MLRKEQENRQLSWSTRTIVFQPLGLESIYASTPKSRLSFDNLEKQQIQMLFSKGRAAEEEKMENGIETERNITNSAIPVIDIREFGDSGLEAYKKLREASEEWGCFRIVNHGMSVNLMAEIKEVVRCLLDRSMEIKRRTVDAATGRGYVGPSKANPLYEALGLYDLASPEALRSFCDQLNTSSRQREIIETYVRAVHELAIDIGRKLAKSVGLDGDLFKGWPFQLRMNKYNFTPESLGSSGVQIHTDSGFLTILQDDEDVGGLEVMNEKGEFVAVDPWPGTLLLNLGDIATVWSNGRFCNVRHRVKCKESAIRVSIATFLLGPSDEVVEAPPELVDNEHPRLYIPFFYDDYWKLRLSKNMRAGEALELVRAPILPNYSS